MEEITVKETVDEDSVPDDFLCPANVPIKLSRKSGKSNSIHKESDIILEVKSKNKTNEKKEIKKLAVPEEKEYLLLPDEIWVYISKFIPPECIGNFALICRQTAAAVNSVAFWRGTLKKYCRYYNDEYARQSLRMEVIHALFRDHGPFLERGNTDEKLELMYGYVFTNIWTVLKKPVTWAGYTQGYLFCDNHFLAFRARQLKSLKSKIKGMRAENWETLADEEDDRDVDQSEDKMALVSAASKFRNKYEGCVLLLIVVKHSKPNFLGPEDEGNLRLLSISRHIQTDMRLETFKFDFADAKTQQLQPSRYLSSVFVYRVIPWWCPDFEGFMKTITENQIS